MGKPSILFQPFTFTKIFNETFNDFFNKRVETVCAAS